ncbi:MAG: DUF2510 domain-containing protein [Ilumatobacteraceae bacterium]
MAEQAAGWLNDPYGRYQQRYWDGAAWTAHVATNGVQQVDPMGNSPVIPIATPMTAFQAPAPDGTAPHGFVAAADLSDPTAQAADPQPPAEGNAVTRFLDGMGDDARLRPRPSLRTALAGIGGLMVAAGLLIVVAGDEPSRGTLIGVSLVVLLVALGLRLTVKLTEVQAAAVGMAVVAIPTLAGAITVSDGSGGALTYLVATALFLAAWALKGFRGRTLLLGLGLLTLVSMFSTVVNDVGQDKCQTYLEDNNFDKFIEECENYSPDNSSSLGFLPDSVTDNLGDQGIVYLLSAALLLGATWWLDRRGYHGTATGTVVAGLISSFFGTALFANKFGDTGGPILVVIVGLLVCVVGSHGGRRATTWWGAILASIGAAAFVLVQWEPKTPGSAGSAVILTGLLLIGIGFIAAPIRRAIAQQRDGGTPGPAPTDPPPTNPFAPPPA